VVLHGAGKAIDIPETLHQGPTRANTVDLTLGWFYLGPPASQKGEWYGADRGESASRRAAH